MAVQVDRQVVAAFLCNRRHHDLVDQLADQVRCLRLRVFVGQGLAQRGDLVAVVVRHVGMNQDRILCRILEPRFNFGFVVFKSRHLVLDAVGRHAVHKRLHQPVQLPLDLRERGLVHLMLRVAFAAQPVHVPRVLFAEFIAQRRVHEAALQSFQYRGFEGIAADGMPVVAGSLVARVRAADPLGIEDNKPAATTAAAHQAREEVMRAATVPIAALLLSAA